MGQEDEHGVVIALRADAAGDLADRTVEEMLDGWRNQQLARNLAFSTIDQRERVVRRFMTDVGELPWRWSSAMVDEWLGDRRTVRGLRQSTIRSLSIALRMFCDYLLDPSYGWGDECWPRFQTHPTQVCHAWNTAVHVQDAESSPAVRAFTLEELQAFFDAADDLVTRAQRLQRKGALTAYRDATLFKVAYAWGLRRREVRMLEVVDFGANPDAPEFGRRGVLYVRHGKAMRGSSPKKRSVLTVFGWAAECLEEYLSDARPFLIGPGEATLWPTERGGVVSNSRVTEHFRTVLRTAGLDAALTFHSLRRSYVTHLIEDGFDPRFVQDQVGHEHASTTSLYTCVSSDFRTRSLRASLDRVVGALNLDTGATE